LVVQAPITLGDLADRRREVIGHVRLAAV
jgi:hypothetical protein